MIVILLHADEHDFSWLSPYIDQAKLPLPTRNITRADDVLSKYNNSNRECLIYSGDIDNLLDLLNSVDVKNVSKYNAFILFIKHSDYKDKSDFFSNLPHIKSNFYKKEDFHGVVKLAIRRTLSTSSVGVEQKMNNRMLRLQLLGDVSADFAHEFNNLVTSTGFAIGIAKSEANSERATAALAIANEAVKRAAALSESLFGIASDEPAGPYHRSLRDIVREISLLVENTLSLSEIVSYQVHEPEYLLFCNQRDLQNALISMIIHSRFLISLNESKSNIVLSLRRSGSKKEIIEFEVLDNGGETPHLGEVADMRRRDYRQSHSIAVAQSFAKTMRGKLDITRNSDGQNISRLVFPINSSQKEHNIQIKNIKRNKICVLIVDDNESLSSLMENELGEENIFAITASSIGGAIEILTTRKDIDILITDIVFPEQRDGRWLAEYVAANLPDITVFGMSGLIREIEDHLFSGFLYKPFTAYELISLINTHVDRLP